MVGNSCKFCQKIKKKHVKGFGRVSYIRLRAIEGNISDA